MKPLTQYTSRQLSEISETLHKAASGRVTCAEMIETLLAQELVPESQKAEAAILRAEAAHIAEGAEIISQIAAKKGRAAA